MSPAFAHSHPTDPPEPLFTPFGEGQDECQRSRCRKCESLDPYHGHLNKVAWWTARFSAAMFQPESVAAKSAWDWGYLAGLWHDLGKFAPEWQAYLKSKSDPHEADITGKLDHSTAGAVFTSARSEFGALLSYMIAGHHSGLPDGTPLFHERISKTIPAWRPSAEASLIPLSLEITPPPLTRPDAGNDGMAFMLRFFFAALVDADFLATEAFMQPERCQLRVDWPDDVISRMLETLEEHMAREFGAAKPTSVNLARETVRKDCVGAAERAVGFFSLTVPTGGGKTLSSLLFALRHARKHGLRQVILVIPFTSIIKQNADVFRRVFAPLSEILGRELVLEHHSKFDPEKETDLNRIAAENWDCPLIVTTNVQFFESLHANRTSACRKLHRIARSVVILDEAQALPVALLHPILRGLRCLVHDLGSSVVFCTATQPALELREGFTVGIPSPEITPIIKDEPALFSALDRVTCENLGALEDNQLISHILDHATGGCLLILNTTKAASALYEKLNRGTIALHLSARMCPAHIIKVLAEAKSRRQAGEAVVLISTQLIEAGVDISFPVVYRAECGLDSFAQAAGRCNRNGELRDIEGLPAKGRVFLFQPTEHPIPRGLRDLATAASITRSQILGSFPDAAILQQNAIRAYFEQAIWQAGPGTEYWDRPHIVSGSIPCFSPDDQSAGWARTYGFKTAAEKFRMIKSDTHPVFIPWDENGKQLADEIRKFNREKRNPNRDHYRRAQQFIVQVYDDEWKHLEKLTNQYCDGSFSILIHPEDDYHPHTGLKRPGSPGDPNAFYL